MRKIGGLREVTPYDLALHLACLLWYNRGEGNQLMKFSCLDFGDVSGINRSKYLILSLKSVYLTRNACKRKDQS